MTFDRRRLLGAMTLGAAGLAIPRSFAAPVHIHVDDSSFPAARETVTRKASRTSAVDGGTTSRSLIARASSALDRHSGMVSRYDVVGLVDFSQPSRNARFQLVDLYAGKVLQTWLVAHGSGSDPAHRGWVERFSNQPGSNASCQGSFVTGPTYTGKHGRSRRLIGLDTENSRALERDIVIHGAGYVDPGMAASQGMIGRSQGCFAVGWNDIGEVLDRLGPGHLLFAAK